MRNFHSIRRGYILSLATIAFLCFVPVTQARDMHARLGVGYNSQFNVSVPGVSMKYGLTKDIAGALILGVKTSDPGKSVSGIKLFKNLFFENNLNFYFLLGGGVLGNAGTTKAEFLTGIGSEFFIPGIESLGFSVETGGSFSNVSGSWILQTTGVSFLDAGIHFYF